MIFFPRRRKRYFKRQLQKHNLSLSIQTGRKSIKMNGRFHEVQNDKNERTFACEPVYPSLRETSLYLSVLDTG